MKVELITSWSVSNSGCAGHTFISFNNGLHNPIIFSYFNFLQVGLKFTHLFVVSLCLFKFKLFLYLFYWPCLLNSVYYRASQNVQFYYAGNKRYPFYVITPITFAYDSLHKINIAAIMINKSNH